MEAHLSDKKESEKLSIRVSEEDIRLQVDFNVSKCFGEALDIILDLVWEDLQIEERERNGTAA